MPRINLPSPEAMDPEQRRVYDKVVSGPRGKVRARCARRSTALSSPSAGRHWARCCATARHCPRVSPNSRFW